MGSGLAGVHWKRHIQGGRVTREAGGQCRGVRTQVEGQVVKVSPAPRCRTDGEKQQVSRSQKHGEYCPWTQPYLDFGLSLTGASAFPALSRSWLTCCQLQTEKNHTASHRQVQNLGTRCLNIQAVVPSLAPRKGLSGVLKHGCHVSSALPDTVRLT